MVRPMASPENKLLGMCFASAVSKSTMNVNDVVARTGTYSMYAALAQCCPSCVRLKDVHCGRHGVSEVEFTKCLDKKGFTKMRDRRKGARPCRFDPTKAGLFLFSNRVWKSPDDPEQLKELKESWAILCKQFPCFAMDCSLDKFLGVCRRFHDGWLPYAWRGNQMKSFGDKIGTLTARNEAECTQLGLPSISVADVKPALSSCQNPAAVKAVVQDTVRSVSTATIQQATQASVSVKEEAYDMKDDSSTSKSLWDDAVDNFFGTDWNSQEGFEMSEQDENERLNILEVRGKDSERSCLSFFPGFDGFQQCEGKGGETTSVKGEAEAYSLEPFDAIEEDDIPQPSLVVNTRFAALRPSALA
ncbi:hypothetical protein GUITHDRAFT_132563 [Guillardia theta CCMP2712]|uniref:Uncharacterized protein n=1 Tax=Guillardia theta (strain CCMP2712) TaxID=905079 RepID=L1K0M7_GUITC|nr:hypothetical protein GUITHDRAFT_132563 [Guillardia theta CCMP2712]EKX54167.1 hypothetical protein GUITHDRAFT_132563 [Guillardia theta CCMP2712]|eukprot:XP_005841147.1 hypothetical protein GUITHDRAFT_132563 [Guillardia theta CCMP2712]